MPGQLLQLLIYLPVCVHTVVVVGIDYAERLADIGPGTQHRVARAEGLFPLGRHLIKIRHAGKILHRVADLHPGAVGGGAPGHIVPADAPHHLLHTRLDDEHDLGKARADSVINRVFHQNFPIGANAVHLLVPAVAGSKSCGHNDKCCLHSRILLHFLLCSLIISRFRPDYKRSQSSISPARLMTACPPIRTFTAPSFSTSRLRMRDGRPMCSPCKNRFSFSGCTIPRS